MRRESSRSRQDRASTLRHFRPFSTSGIERIERQISSGISHWERIHVHRKDLHPIDVQDAISQRCVMTMGAAGPLMLCTPVMAAQWLVQIPKRHPAAVRRSSRPSQLPAQTNSSVLRQRDKPVPALRIIHIQLKSLGVPGGTAWL